MRARLQQGTRSPSASAVNPGTKIHARSWSLSRSADKEARKNRAVGNGVHRPANAWRVSFTGLAQLSSTLVIKGARNLKKEVRLWLTSAFHPLQPSRRVSQSYDVRSAAFAGGAVDQDAPMQIHHVDYAQLSEDAMAAADRAATLEECQDHLARAVKYASLACLERQRSPDFNIVEIRPGALQQR